MIDPSGARRLDILIIEDDLDTRAHVTRNLSRAGHRIVEAGDAREGLAAAMEGRFDAIVIDRLLPDLDGLRAVRELREKGCTAPVLMLSSKGAVADRIEGLLGGADDYLPKPFDLGELAARLHALTRRIPRGDPMTLRVGQVQLDFGTRRVTRAGRRVVLQPREFLLLAEFMRNPGCVLTRSVLLERIWNFHFSPQTNLVETHISRLRSKLNAGFCDDAIRTVRGLGYVMPGRE